MAGGETGKELSSFLHSGIYRFPNSIAVFMDPVRVLNDSYTRFRVSPSSYYSRFCEPKENEDVRIPGGESRKRKRKKGKHDLNERERSAEKRHQEARPFLLTAHEALLGAWDLLSFLSDLKRDGCHLGNKGSSHERKDNELSFVGLGSVWQAPLYEMSLHFYSQKKQGGDEGMQLVRHGEGVVVPIFSNLVSNETNDDAEAEFLDRWFILPRKSCFHMSDLGQIRNLIPADSAHLFNLIVIDPPWENRSVHQKSVYPMLPNRNLLSLPVKQLAHTEGALVALWVTNREKLRVFVEKELFPAWDVLNVTEFYWLKVKADGSLIGELDLFHHRPYECLLLGYISGKGTNTEHASFKTLQDNQVIISIPGDHSRKPPIGKLLLDYIPGPKPARCIELFARELTAGWTSWGNEPLRFQDSGYFIDKNRKE
eukprot:TRINITY_DN4208_c1_g1_i8.p1 TRINITY_DN4208_c1_g1~~TRINITY_DN4208_c1_g1_i8.p1  ORF type:complete len:426 (-),score=64.60 TRINITY_DN4208_c1_g1_i8:198-1475(-)